MCIIFSFSTFFSGDTLHASYELSSSLSYCEYSGRSFFLTFMGTAVLVKIQSPAVSNTGTAGEQGMPQQPFPFYTFPSYCTSHIFPVNVRWLTDLLQPFFLSSWQSICFKPHCILFVCHSLITILKKQTNKMTNYRQLRGKKVNKYVLTSIKF